MQAAHRYIDIRAPAAGGLQVSLLAYFKLHKANDLDDTPWLLQSIRWRRVLGVAFVLRHRYHMPRRAPCTGMSPARAKYHPNACPGMELFSCRV
mmetsp:Transcript_62474/g.91555  ORF Transcript_62474/g.91555 Transcript_62474/m.91555 type:complete len:94 (-) Transcript_62474:334-615(-)